MKSSIFYVYTHTFSDGKVYIGKGKDSRSTDFRHRSEYWKRTLAKYGDPVVSYIDSSMSEEDAFELEEFLIYEHIDCGYTLGGSLVNLSLGGEGASGYEHTDEAKRKISEASKKMWADAEKKEAFVNTLVSLYTLPERKKRRSMASKKMWGNPAYRSNKVKEMQHNWNNNAKRKDEASKRMSGANNHAARTANIYCYETDSLIAEDVVSTVWARENGYSRPKLQVTAKADRSKPSSKDNPHHHKLVYMRYTDGK